MSVIRDSKSDRWRVSFEHNGDRYRKKGFPSREAAEEWEYQKRITVGAGMDADSIKHRAIKSAHGIQKATTLEELRFKYHEVCKNPHNTVGMIFDMVMEDLRLHPRYNDVVKAAGEALNGKRSRPSPMLRARVIRRDKSTCQMCGAKAPEVRIHVDHIVPLSRGGLTEERNLRVLCEACNIGKRALPPTLADCY